MIRTFDRSARAVVVAAVQQARTDLANEIRDEHLLRAVLADPATRRTLDTASHGTAAQETAAQETAAQNPAAQNPAAQDPATLDTDALFADIAVARRRAGLTAVEADALADIGIDVDAVVSRIEAELGEGALDDSRRARRGRTRMSPTARQVLEAAQRQAVAAADRSITAEHLLLGLLATPGVVADALAAQRITLASFSDRRAHPTG